MNYIINKIFGVSKEEIKDKSLDLDYRKIRNYLRKHSSTIADDYDMRLKLQQLFYYDIDGIPIAKLKLDDVIYNNDYNYPYYFQNKMREEIIEIYNKEVKTPLLP